VRKIGHVIHPLGAFDMIRAIGLVLTLGCFSALEAAQGSQDPLDACAQQTDANARLACFDHEMQRRHTTTSASAKPATQGTPASATPPAAAVAQKRADDNVGLQGKDLQKKLKEQGTQTEPEAVKPIVATITRVLPRPDNQYAFELDNGQTWEQAESKADFYVKPHEAVTIESGVLGAFFLKTKTHQRVRVHRIE
jgi:hypothetical protein